VIAEALGYLVVLALVGVWYFGFRCGRWAERRWPRS
jgi:hypothetical protein